MLLRAGFDVNIRTKAGTALHEAALCGKVEVVRTLLEHGVDISIKDSHDFTVTDLLSQFPAQATQEIMGILKSKFVVALGGYKIVVQNFVGDDRLLPTVMRIVLVNLFRRYQMLTLIWVVRMRMLGPHQRILDLLLQTLLLVHRRTDGIFKGTTVPQRDLMIAGCLERLQTPC